MVFSCGLEDLVPPQIAEEPIESGEVRLSWKGPGDAVLAAPVYINGQGPFHFLLDTGATNTCLHRDLADRLQLEARPGESGVAAGVGGMERIHFVTIDTLAVGDAAVAGMTACVISLDEVRAIGVEADGLLGLNFLRQRSLTIDFDRMTLAIN
jgi:clan AA aspartic protease (TIGR02281 family)